MKDFQKLVPNDPEDIFWTHLELLRKMKLIGIEWIDGCVSDLLIKMLVTATLRHDPQKVAQRKELHKPQVGIIMFVINLWFVTYKSCLCSWKSFPTMDLH